MTIVVYHSKLFIHAKSHKNINTIVFAVILLPFSSSFVSVSVSVFFSFRFVILRSFRSFICRASECRRRFAIESIFSYTRTTIHYYYKCAQDFYRCWCQNILYLVGISLHCVVKMLHKHDCVDGSHWRLVRFCLQYTFQENWLHFVSSCRLASSHPYTFVITFSLFLCLFLSHFALFVHLALTTHIHLIFSSGTDSHATQQQ